MTEFTFLGILALIHLFRHLLGPELFVFLFYKVFRKKLDSLKIQKLYPSQEQLQKERTWIGKSQLVDLGIIIISIYLYKEGLFKLSFDLDSKTLMSSAITLLALTISQDLYFYLTHRLLHTRWLYRNIHLVHHQSVLTSPLTSFSVHPLEKFIELLFFPLILLVLPVTGGELLVFIFFSSLVNIFGHAGFEFKRLIFKKPDPVGATSVFHEMHHMYPNTNFSLYFTIWDKLFKTQHQRYLEFFSGELKAR